MDTYCSSQDLALVNNITELAEKALKSIIFKFKTRRFCRDGKYPIDVYGEPGGAAHISHQADVTRHVTPKLSKHRSRLNRRGDTWANNHLLTLTYIHDIVDY